MAAVVVLVPDCSAAHSSSTGRVGPCLHMHSVRARNLAPGLVGSYGVDFVAFFLQACVCSLGLRCAARGVAPVVRPIVAESGVCAEPSAMRACMATFCSRLRTIDRPAAATQCALYFFPPALVPRACRRLVVLYQSTAHARSRSCKRRSHLATFSLSICTRLAAAPPAARKHTRLAAFMSTNRT